ncbi:MAG: hypothetical protein ACI30K_06710 [Muribaculaceae bacterium]
MTAYTTSVATVDQCAKTLDALALAIADHNITDICKAERMIADDDDEAQPDASSLSYGMRRVAATARDYIAACNGAETTNRVTDAELAELYRSLSNIMLLTTTDEHIDGASEGNCCDTLKRNLSEITRSRCADAQTISSADAHNAAMAYIDALSALHCLICSFQQQAKAIARSKRL